MLLTLREWSIYGTRYLNLQEVICDEVLLCRSKRQAEKARKFRRLHSDHVKGRQ